MMVKLFFKIKGREENLKKSTQKNNNFVLWKI